MIIKGTFTSIWDDGQEINTDATLNTETGEVSAESTDADGLDILDEEYFTDKEGTQYPVCSECHEYIVVTSMENGIGHNLDEVKRCKNPNCDYEKII